ncbi:MAG: hypothetical protein QNJ40_26845 [Xanthomonadales bacterium]|nr:hypothetical protein [Xanthomonadales bacterium]
MLAVTLVSLSACADSDQAPADTTTSLAAGEAKSAGTPLPLTSISAEQAFGRVPPTVIEPGPCPFLADQTALATANASPDRPLLRQLVSNDRCLWSYNSGFAVDIRIEPTDTATPLSERRYNIGEDAEVSNQEGPGDNAAVLLDATWGEPRPFAFGFEQGDRSVLIKVTGMTTTPESLRRTAEEIAARLPQAPEIQPVWRQIQTDFDTCQVWPEAALLSLFGRGETEYTVAANGRNQYCTFEFSGREYRPGEKLRVDLNFVAHDKDVSQNLVEKGARALDGYDVPVLSRSRTDDFGHNATLHAFIGNDEVIVNVSSQEGPEDDRAATLLRNLLTRLATEG